MSIKRYKIPMQEQVKIWQHIDVTIETEDDIETVWKHIKEGDFILHYGFDECVTVDTMWETEEQIDVSYEYTEKEDIEEIADVGTD